MASDLISIQIQFRTSGHRGILGRHLLLHVWMPLCMPLSRSCIRKPCPSIMIIGYDCRTATKVQRKWVCHAGGDAIDPSGHSGSTVGSTVPTPVVSDTIRAQGAGLGIMLTASQPHSTTFKSQCGQWGARKRCPDNRDSNSSQCRSVPSPNRCR